MIKYKATVKVFDLSQRKVAEIDLGQFPNRNEANRAVQHYQQGLTKGLSIASFRLVPLEISEQIFNDLNRYFKARKMPLLKSRNIPLEFMEPSKDEM